MNLNLNDDIIYNKKTRNHSKDSMLDLNLFNTQNQDLSLNISKNNNVDVTSDDIN